MLVAYHAGASRASRDAIPSASLCHHHKDLYLLRSQKNAVSLGQYVAQRIVLCSDAGTV